MCPPWKEMGNLFVWDVGNFFASVFTGKCPSLCHRRQRQGLGDWRTSHFRSRSGSRPLSNLNVHKFMESDEMHPIVLRELTDEVLKPLFVMFEKSWQSYEDPIVGGSGVDKENTTPLVLKTKKKKRKIRGTTGQLSHLHVQQDCGADHPGNYAKGHGKQRCLVTTNMASLSSNCACQVQWPSATGLQHCWIREEQLTSSTQVTQSIWCCPMQHPCL